MKNLRGILAAACLLGSVGTASAGTVVLNSAQFASSTVNPINGNFSDVPVPNCSGSACFGGGNPLAGYASLQHVSFSTTNLGGNVNVDTAGFYGPNDLSVPYAVNSVFTDTGAPDNITITLPYATKAFGLDFNTLFSSTTETFSLSNGFSTSVSNTANISGGPNEEFIGFVSSDPFNQLTLSVPSDQSIVIADFTTAGVPEPASWVMLILGFFGLGTLIRLRRNASAILTA
jgi:hypothetical protein